LTDKINDLIRQNVELAKEKDRWKRACILACSIDRVIPPDIKTSEVPMYFYEKAK